MVGFITNWNFEMLAAMHLRKHGNVVHYEESVQQALIDGISALGY